ncbi:MAG: hypothetical protein ABI861_07325, partial [Panacibacter sp.]
MKTFLLKTTVLFLFLLTTASITRAQSRIITGKVIENSRLKKTIFETPEGKILLYLPADMRNGDIISGTVYIKPGGKNEKTMQKNLTAAKQYTLMAGDTKVDLTAASPSFSMQVPNNITSINISLHDAQNVALSNVATNIAQTPAPSAPSSIAVPTHCMVGEPLQIAGPFDGNMSNTFCSIDGKPLEVLAESPRRYIIMMPADATGIHSVAVQENAMHTEQKVSGVNLDVSAGRLNLLKGETTYINISITGLQNLPDTAVLSIMNFSTPVVTVAEGNKQMIPIIPGNIDSGGRFTKQLHVQSLRTGTYSINVNLDLPEPLVMYNIFCNDKCNPVGAETDATVSEIAISSSEKSDPDAESGALKTAHWLVKNADLFGATGNEESALDAMLTAARTRGYVVWVKYCWQRCEKGWLCNDWETYCGNWVPVIWVDGLENSGSST